ncbi:MAG: hypothetical protein SF339_20400 [Blastocatellia bacterium]|nr:hypothetical protein [Blastocatellia bacterium]
MKSYNSFLIRCWAIRSEAEEKFVFDVEHIQQGDHRRTTTPEELIAWILERSQDPPAQTETQATDE